jgi:hypothetical protein
MDVLFMSQSRRGTGMQPSATQPPDRSSAFGTRTSFKRPGGSISAAIKFGLLRTFKPEHDARQIGSLHFAYWALLSRRRIGKLLRASGRKQAAKGSQLLFFSDFSGDWEVYLAGFNAVLLLVLDLVWGNASGWKNEMNLDQYLTYIREHQLLPPVYVQSYGDRATVYDVRCAIALSEQLDRFVADAGHDERAFEAAYAELLMTAGTNL